MKINSDGKDYLNRIGKVSYIKHYVIPEKIMVKNIMFIV